MVQDYLGEKLKELGLEMKEVKEKERIVIMIEGDVNDADYVTEVTELSLNDNKRVDQAMEIIKIIHKHYDELIEHHGVEEIINEGWGWFDELTEDVSIPGDEMGYCHTIVEINVDYFTNSGRQYRII